VPMIAELLGHLLQAQGAENYVAFELDHEELGPLVLLLQRRWGKEPHTIAAELRARLDAAKAACVACEANSTELGPAMAAVRSALGMEG
ncbi:MAG: hypothetical protein E7K72_27860, partial [Roseomonas mucosa]|nr:hypothetical protein [Roseomonas mucosa]